jgi:NADH-quinone oxidoreductase subunit J
MFPIVIAQNLLFNRIPVDWTTILAAVIAGLGAYLVQTSDTSSQRRSASKWIGIVLLIASAIVVMTRVPMTLERLLFFKFCGLAIIGCVAFVTARQPVYAACNFAVAVLSVCGLFMLLSAPFLAAATMIVYTGATIIIFLFVLMFAQRAHLQVQDVALNTPGLAMIASVGFLCLILIASAGYKVPGLMSVGDAIRVSDIVATGEKTVNDSVDVANPAAEASSLQLVAKSPRPTVAGLGRVMYTEYLWLVEIAGSLLTVAAIGSIVIARNRDYSVPVPEVARSDKS